MHDITPRGWLTGLLAALAGAVSKLFGQSSAPARKEDVPTANSALPVRVPDGWSKYVYQPLKGKVIIEPTAVDGELMITVLDREGHIIEKSCGKLHAVHIYGNPSSPVLVSHYHYDATRLQQLPNQAITYVYDSQGRKDTPPAEPQNI